MSRARNTFPSGGVRDNLRIDLPPGLPQVTANRRWVVQVLTNLLNHAAGHSPESSTIRVSAARDRVHVAFSVADDGGISPERLPHLFRKFSQQGDDRESGTVAAGLGNGHLQGDLGGPQGADMGGERGGGSGGQVHLHPAGGGGDRQRPQPQVGVAGQGGRQQPRVLAVDDDPQARRYVRDTLSQAGYAVMVTGDPEEELRLMGRERPHLVLLDLSCPTPTASS